MCTLSFLSLSLSLSYSPFHFSFSAGSQANYRIVYFGQRLLLMNENADKIAVNAILCNIFYV